jgi:hypothetical protein
VRLKPLFHVKELRAMVAAFGLEKAFVGRVLGLVAGLTA